VNRTGSVPSRYILCMMEELAPSKVTSGPTKDQATLDDAQIVKCSLVRSFFLVTSHSLHLVSSCSEVRLRWILQVAMLYGIHLMMISCELDLKHGILCDPLLMHHLVIEMEINWC
jgi:hypothetical protein